MSLNYDFTMAFDLLPDTPSIVLDTLNYMTGQTEARPSNLPDHEFFQGSGWKWLIRPHEHGGYLPGEYGSRLRSAYRYTQFGKDNFRDTLSFRCYVLDDGFYENWWQFAEWIAPHSETTGWVGYYRERYHEHPTLIYFKGGQVYLAEINPNPIPIRSDTT